MAEIKIKKKSSIWPWVVLLLIVLAAIAYYLITSGRIETGDDKPHIGQDEQIENETGQSSIEFKNAFELPMMVESC